MKGSLKHDPGRYASGRKKPPSQKLARSLGTNKQFHKLGLHYGGVAGRKQASFPEVCGWTEKRCQDSVSETQDSLLVL